MRLYDNLSIGLFGGSFNPAHDGHMHVAQCGLRELGLDLNLSPRMDISHLERDFGTQYTIDLIRNTQICYPRTRFVFLMGADNFAQLPEWRNWIDITTRIPIAVISRPGDGLKPRLSKTAQMLSSYRLPEEQSHILHYLKAPVWTFLTPPLNSQSSTAIRKAMAKD